MKKSNITNSQIKKVLQRALKLFRGGRGWIAGEMCRLNQETGSLQYCLIGALNAAAGGSSKQTTALRARVFKHLALTNPVVIDGGWCESRNPQDCLMGFNDATSYGEVARAVRRSIAGLGSK